MVDTFNIQWKITLEQMAGSPLGDGLDKTQLLTSHRFSYFALSYDCEHFAYSGLSSTVYVWNLIEKRLLHEILIPSFQDKLIIQIQFIGTSSVRQNMFFLSDSLRVYL